MSKAQSLTASHQQGQAVANGLLGGTQTAAKSADLQTVPQFKTATPSETDLTASSLENRAGASLRSNEAGQFLLESHHKRPTFKIDEDRDPLITQAKEAVQNPLRTLEVTVKAEGSEGSAATTTVVCEEEGDPYPEACIIRIHPEIRLKYERVFVRCYHWGWSDSRKIYNEYLPYPFQQDVYDWEWKPDENLRHEHYRNEYQYQKRFEATNADGSVSVSDPTDMSPQEYQEVLDKTKTAAGQVSTAPVPLSEIVQAESEHSSCLVLEDLVERGVCQYGEKVCAEPKQTRAIQGVPITRDCWAYRQTYSCIEPLPVGNACQTLRAKGCVQISSTCKTKKYGVCLVYQQTYSCPTGKAGLKKL